MGMCCAMFSNSNLCLCGFVSHSFELQTHVCNTIIETFHALYSAVCIVCLGNS